MNNIKGIAVANDGNMKRIAVTYDVLDENGKVVKANMKASRMVSDEAVLASVAVLEEHATSIIEE